MNNKKNHFQSSSIVSKARDDILNIIEQDYEEFKKTRGSMVLPKVNCLI